MMHQRIVRLTLCAVLATGAAVTALGIRPAHAQVREELEDGDKAYDNSDWKKAAAAYDNAIRKYPKQVSAEAYAKRASIFLILSQEARNGGKDKLADALLEDGLKFLAQKAEPVHGKAPEILEQKALMLWGLKSKPDAVKLAEEVAKQRPSSFASQRLIGEFYAAREPKRAITALEAYFQHRPNEMQKQDVLPRIHLGFAYLSVARSLRRGAPDKAKELAEKARDQFETLLVKHKQARHAEVNANNGLCAAYTFLGEYNRAITICEKIIQNPARIDRAGSVFFNLGEAYLQLRRADDARTVGREFIRLRKSEAKGYILVGDAYGQERNWEKALENYKKAEEYAKNRSEYAAEIGIRLGISYRRANQIDLAIAKLEEALQNDPDNPDLIIELARAYLAAREDQKALARVEAAMSAKSFETLAEEKKVNLLVLAGKAAYNIAAKDPKNSAATARKHFAAAYQLRPKDVTVRIGLVRTINLEAYRERKDPKKAEAFLDEAYQIDKNAPSTNQNLAVLDIERGDCDAARQKLGALAKARAYALTYHRLLARTYLCGKHRDEAKAADHYARAEKEASGANLMRAEIYIEWAPLVWDKDLDKAVDMLESAAQFTAQSPDLGPMAQRNLALALFRRGWRDLHKGGDPGRAADDFARASRDPGVLKGTELEAFEFSEALARLERNDNQTASKLFDKLAKSKGSYLKAPYDKVGAEFFGAYAKYRAGSPANRRQAVTDFNKLSRGAKGAFARTLRELQAATYVELAVDSYQGGSTRNASKYLSDASRYASGAMKRLIAHNTAVVQMGSKFDKGLLATFDKMNTDPPEALANKGIMLDREGRPKQAYEAWVLAQKKGVRSRSLSNWISAKKRIFGY